MNQKVHTSTLALITIAMFDLVTTLILLNRGDVAEANPFFAYLASHGSLVFVLGKLLFLAGPILILEYVRTKKPASAEIGTWIAFGLYFYLYASHILRITQG